MDKGRVFEIGSYFLEQGYQVLPITPTHKYPAYIDDWQNFRFSGVNELASYINRGYGLGLMPNNDFVYFDLDTDHGDYNGLENFKGLVSHCDSLYAIKSKSKNLHMFYKYPGFDFRFTGNQAILPGVECSTRDSFIRIEPAYEFRGLDLTIPFEDQLNNMNQKLTEILRISRPIEKPYKTKSKRKHHIDKYLAKIPPFEVGSRSQSYRQLVYTMVVKNGMQYDEVREAIIQWDKDTIDFQDDEPDQFFHAIREVE